MRDHLLTHALVYNLAILMSAILHMSSIARAADVTSTLVGSGTWTTNSIWSSVLFPNNGNGGLTYDAVVNSGSVDIPALTQIAIEALTLGGGGMISGAGGLQLNASSSWTAGILAGPTPGMGELTIGGSGPLTVSNACCFKFFSGSVTNAGTLVWQDGAPIAPNAAGSTFTNIGLIDHQGDGTSFGLLSSPGTLVNAAGGTLRRSVGTGTADIAMPLTNNGAIEVDTGILRIQGGGNSTGTFDIATGAEVNFNSNTFTFQNGASSTGAGLVHLSGGTVDLMGTNSLTNLRISNGTLNANGNAQVANLQLTGGTVSGAGTVTLTGPSSWMGNNLSILSGPTPGTGQLTIGGTGPLSVTGDNDKRFNGAVTNAGTLVWQQGRILSTINGSTFTNTGLVDLQGDVTSFSTVVASGSVINAAGGTLRRSVGTGTASIDMPLTNDGTIEVDMGILGIQGGGSSTGTFDVAMGAEVSFNSNSFTFQNGASSTGAGFIHIGGTVELLGSNNFTNLRVSGGTLNANGNAQVANLQINGGTVGGSGTLTLTGSSTWAGNPVKESRLSGPTPGTGQLTIGGTGPLTLPGGGDVFFSGAVTNATTMNWQGNSRILSRAGGSTFTNAGLVDLQGDGSSFSPASSPGSLINAAGGTLRRSVGTGTASIDMPLTNDGAIEVRSGTLSIAGGLSNIDVLTSTLSGGAYRAIDSGGGATLQVQGAPAITTLAAGTTVELSGANPVMQFGTTDIRASLVNNAGTLQIRNGLTYTPVQPFNNTGTIELGIAGLAAATLNAGNSLTNGAGGAIVGHGQINGAFINQGSLSGNSSAEFLEINGAVSGAGSMKNVRIDNTHIVGLADTTAIVALEGSYLLNGSGVRLAMDLNGTAPGTEHDQLASTGTVALDGILDVEFIDADFSYDASSGDRFTIITSTNPLTGAFDVINLPMAGGGAHLTWLPVDLSNPNEVVLEIATATPYTADYDLDGEVDGRDFLVWQRGGSPSSLSRRDLALWQQAYGGGGPVSAAVTVPEPDAVMLLFGGLVLWRRP